MPEPAPANLVLVKHAMPVLEADVPPRHWQLDDRGEAEASVIASALAEFAPAQLYTSPEPKARQTAEIIAPALGASVRSHPGLVEFDRPALPLMDEHEHASLNRRVFAEPSLAVLGSESADAAQRRFAAAIDEIVGTAAEHHATIAMSHGTVISLFVASHNDLDAFDLWQSLRCGGACVLRLPDFALIELLHLT